MTSRWSSLISRWLAIPLVVGASACGAAGDAESDSEDALLTAPVGRLVAETAPTQAIVLANADLFAGINELHYTFLRGLFSDRALDEVKVIYLTPDDTSDVVTPVRAKDGDRSMGRFSARFAAEIASGRLKRTRATIETNWPRDYFPMTVRDPAAPAEKKAVRFEYDVMPGTGPAAEAAARTLGFAVTKSELSLEGGNILIDEDGTLFVTTKILARNASKTKTQVETELKRALGATEIEWLNPLPGETTGHVDIIAKIVGKKRAVVGASDGVCGADAPPACSKRKAALDETAKAFERRGYRVTRVLNAESAGDVRALTYANALLVNGTAFLPMYFDPGVADDLVLTMTGPRVPAKAIVKACNDSNPFPGTNDLAADLVARERARCAIEGVVKAAKAAGEPTDYLQYSLTIAQRDAEARKSYEALGLRVVQVPGAAMINFGGSVHCVTMQIPK